MRFGAAVLGVFGLPDFLFVPVYRLDQRAANHRGVFLASRAYNSFKRFSVIDCASFYSRRCALPGFLFFAHGKNTLFNFDSHPQRRQYIRAYSLKPS